MESKSIIKEFNCKKHPEEKVQRVSAVDGSCALYCIDCMIAIEDKQIKEALLPLKEYIPKVITYFEKFQQNKTIPGDAPLDLVTLLDTEDEVMSKISAHIDGEKNKVELSFGEVIQTFSTLCIKAKQDILAKLDNQLFNIRNNYRYFKRKVKKYYGKLTKDEICELTSETGILTSINKCESVDELEYLLRQINDEIYEDKVLYKSDDKVEGMKEVLEDLKRIIRLQGEKLPKTQFSDPVQSRKTIDTLMQATKEFIKELSCLENETLQLLINTPIMEDSKILNDSGEFRMIKSWLAPKPYSIRLKLLLRGTRDGFEAETFHKICDNKKNTLVLVKNGVWEGMWGFY